MGCVPLFPDTVMAGRWPEEIRDQTAGFLAATFLSPLARSRARALLARSAAFDVGSASAWARASSASAVVMSVAGRALAVRTVTTLARTCTKPASTNHRFDTSP